MRRLCSSTCSPAGETTILSQLLCARRREMGEGRSVVSFLHVLYVFTWSTTRKEGRRNSLPAVDDPSLRKNDALPPLYTRVSVHEFILARFLATFEAVATRGISTSMVFLMEMELGFDSSLDFGNVWRNSS